MRNNLSTDAKEALAEQEEFGKKITSEINLKWNRMELALEKGNPSNFIKLSKEVQALLKVLVGDIDFVRSKFGGARYCVAVGVEKDIAGSLVDDVRKIVENEVTPLGRGVI